MKFSPLYFIIQIQYSQINKNQPRIMKSNIPSSQISFKKSFNPHTSNKLSFLSKNKTRSTQTSPQKSNFNFDKQRHLSQHMICLNHFQIPQESSSTLDQLDINKSILFQTKPSTSYHLSPPRINSKDQFAPQIYSTRQVSPSLSSSTMEIIQSIPLRSTLKNMQKSSQTQQHLTNAFSPNKSYTHSFNLAINHRNNKHNIAYGQLMHENKKLRQQNLYLKQSLQQIKKNIIYQVCNKNQQTIISLRQALSIKDQQINNMELILQQQIKHNNTLLKQIQAKDDQISTLSFDISQLHQQMAENEQKSQRYEKLCSKISRVFKMYNILQQQYMLSQNQWSDFVIKWQQQKSMYMHRINFLQEYIASN